MGFNPLWESFKLRSSCFIGMVIRDSVHESNTVAQSTLPASLNIGNSFFSPIAGLRMDIGPVSTVSTNVFFPTLWLIPAADITFILSHSVL